MDKQFPIILPFSKRLYKGPRSVPWALVAPHEAQALKNHGGQSLERLAERGGLSLDELVAVLEDRRWLSMPDEYALQNLQNHLDEFSKLEQEKLEYSDTYKAPTCRQILEFITQEFESAIREWDTEGKGGQQTNGAKPEFYGAIRLPSLSGRFRWWAKLMRETLDKNES